MAAGFTVWPGRPYPLGATWDGEGVNFALFSEHAEKVELCLFDAKGRREIATHRLAGTDRSGLARLSAAKRGPGSSTATACTAPTTRRRATASTPTSCCSIPTPRSIVGQHGLDRRPFRLPRRQSPARTCPSTAATAPPACPSAGSSTPPSPGATTGRRRFPGTTR